MCWKESRTGFPTDELDALIQESATENLAVLETGTVEKAPLLQQPMLVVLSWLLLFFVCLFFYLNPVGEEPHVGEKSKEARLSVALYQLAYRIEVYEALKGTLPDYLEEEWSDAGNIRYSLGDNGYILSGQLGDYELTYRQGEDPETLMRIGVSR